MNILVTADKNWAIGNQGQLLVSIPEDQRLLREETLGGIVVMGRKTFETLPGKQPLYNLKLEETGTYCQIYACSEDRNQQRQSPEPVSQIFK